MKVLSIATWTTYTVVDVPAKADAETIEEALKAEGPTGAFTLEHFERQLSLPTTTDVSEFRPARLTDLDDDCLLCRRLRERILAGHAPLILVTPEDGTTIHESLATA